MFGFGENKSRTFLQNGDPVGSINSASLNLRGKSMGYSEKVRDKKKKFLVFLFVFSVAGGVFTTSHFFDQGTNTAFGQSLETGDDDYVNDVGDGPKTGTKSSSINPIKWLLYGVFNIVGWFASVAVTLFGWAIDPKYISGDPGLFNTSGIYDMWKFIRDFFNLFFILVLLYIAFTVVFQIQKDFKKALLSLVLAALFINFSFPVTRFLIDATNVPMYFFVNQMFGSSQDSAGGSLGTVLQVSELENILVPEEKGLGDLSAARLLAAIIFMFMFSITLLVLAVMFVIRLIALLILLVFSAAGFAASIIPGMEQYSKMWWENFWKYALFGPAAMLMLLIATKFFSSIAGENGLMKGFTSVAATSTVPDDLDIIASMAMFSIPIIMLWFAMGLAQKMSLAGASSVVGAGQKFAKWAGKKTMDGGKWATYNNPVMRGVGGGLKEKTGISKVQKWWKAPSKTEAYLKGGVIGVGGEKGWKDGAAHELRSIKDKEIREKAAEHKKNNTSVPTLEQELSSGNEVTRKASALALAESKNINSPEQLQKALAAVKDDMNMYSKVLESASKDALGMNGNQIKASLKDGNKDEDKAMADKQLKAVSAKMKREGKAKGIVEYEVNVSKKTIDEAYAEAYADTIGKMGSEDIAKQEGIHSDPAFHKYVQNNMDPKKMQSVMNKVMEKAGDDVQAEWTKILSGAKIEVGSPKIVVEEGYRTRPRT